MATKPAHEIPQGERLLVAAEVDAVPHTAGRWQRTTARIGYFRPESSGQWTGVSEKIQLYADTSSKIAFGDRLLIKGYLNPVDTYGGSYGRLMESRGIGSRMFATKGGIKARTQYPSDGLAGYTASLQETFARRIEKLEMDPENEAMAKALAAGDKRGVNSALKDSYSRAGVIHIMSVSGLHMGFVLVIANILLAWVVFLPKGHIVKNISVILFLWIYAAAAGLSPSVVRAALMLSAVQTAFAVSSRTTGYNTLFAAATVMLAVNPSYLFDISFQLSFMAVFSIMFFYPRLYRRKLCRNKIADFAVSSLLLSIAAQIGTIPLVAYNFGRIPALAIVINPVVIVTSFIIIAATLIWVLIPLGILSPVFSTVIAHVSEAQNFLVEKAASMPGASSGEISPAMGWTIGMYAVMLLAMLAIKAAESHNRSKIPIFAK